MDNTSLLIIVISTVRRLLRFFLVIREDCQPQTNLRNQNIQIAIYDKYFSLVFHELFQSLYHSKLKLKSIKKI